MAEISQNFFKGKMNKDLDERFLEDGEYFHAENIRVASPSEGNVGVVKNIPSSIARIVYNSFPNIKALSFAKDEINNKIYLFLKANNVKDFIVEYDTLTKTSVSIVETYYPNSVLNFADDVFSEAKILDGYLIWTDNINPPRKINIATMRLKAFNSIKEDYLSLIKKPPLKEPRLILKRDSNTLVNELSESMLKIAYRYIYEDNSKSSTSFWSETAYLPNTYFSYDLATNSVIQSPLITSIDVIVDVGDSRVKEIEILTKDINSNNVYVAKVLNKETLEIISSEGLNISYYTVNISSPKEGYVLPEQESLKLFNNVPLKAKELSIVDSRVFFGNYIDGYDLKRNNQKVVPNVKISQVTNIIGASSPITYSQEGWLIKTKVNTYDFNLPMYNSEFFRKGTLLNFYTQISRFSDVYNFNVIESLSFSYLLTNTYNNFNAFATDNIQFFTGIISEFQKKGYNATFALTSTTLKITLVSAIDNSDITELSIYSNLSRAASSVGYKHELPYEFGIVYYDDYNRSSTVLLPKNSKTTFPHKKDLNIVNILGQSQLYSFNAKLEINHLAPNWATKFKFVRRAYEHKHELLTQPLKIYYASGVLQYVSYKRIISDEGIKEDAKFRVGGIIDLYAQNSTFNYAFSEGGFISTPYVSLVKRVSLKILGIDDSTDERKLTVISVKGNFSDLSDFATTHEGTPVVTYYGSVIAEIYYTPTTKQNFYEIPKTYYIDSNGYHIGGSQNQTASTSFSDTLLDGDVFTDNTGRSHYKLKNEFNGKEFDNIDSLRVNNVTSAGGQQHRYASITYSGKYIKENSLNELNSFNLASGNFEDFDKNNGDIMKMHPREGDLLVFQENGINKILLGKSVLYGGDGTVNVSAIENVLGQKIEFPYRNGISKNPESFDYDGNVVFFSDANRGVICALDNDGLIEISDTGMSGFFKQLLKDNSSVKIKGAYDKINEEYVINIVTSNDNKTLSFNKNAKGWIAFYDYKPELIIPINNKLFTIGSESNTLTLYEHGYDYNFRGNLHGKQVKSKITTFLNKEYETVKIANYISLDSTHPCETKLSTGDKHTTIYENEFVEKEDSFVAYVRRNENTTDKSGKHLKGLSNFVSLNNKTITVTLQLDSSLIRIGDTLCKYNSTDGVVNIGVIESYIGNTITVNAVNTTLSNGDFILSKRSLREEGSAIRGDVFKAEVTMPTTNSAVELSSITLGVSKSFV